MMKVDHIKFTYEIFFRGVIQRNIEGRDSCQVIFSRSLLPKSVGHIGVCGCVNDPNRGTDRQRSQSFAERPINYYVNVIGLLVHPEESYSPVQCDFEEKLHRESI